MCADGSVRSPRRPPRRKARRTKDQALINRFLGWFVLLAFGATGALIAAAGGRDGLGSCC